MRNTLLIMLVAVLAFGCQTKRSPSASDTVLRSSYSDSATAADMASGNSVNPDSLAAQGLSARDEGFKSIDENAMQKGILPSVYFAFDKATLSSDERAKLTQAAEYLKTNTAAKVLVEGYCDWKGTAEYNLGLGDRRAHAVKMFLKELGVEETRVGTVSKGDLEAVNNGTDEQMRNDRRADLLILNK